MPTSTWSPGTHRPEQEQQSERLGWLAIIAVVAAICLAAVILYYAAMVLGALFLSPAIPVVWIREGSGFLNAIRSAFTSIWAWLGSAAFWAGLVFGIVVFGRSLASAPIKQSSTWTAKDTIGMIIGGTFVFVLGLTFIGGLLVLSCAFQDYRKKDKNERVGAIVLGVATVAGMVLAFVLSRLGLY